MSTLHDRSYDYIFAEEILKCVLAEKHIPWDALWGLGSVSEDRIPDFKVCRNLVAECVSAASIRYRPLVMDEGLYVWDGMMNSADKKLLLPSLMRVGDKLGTEKDSFFIFMAIISDLCVRFYRAGQTNFIIHVLKAMVHVMRNIDVTSPETLRKKAMTFLEAISCTDART